MRVFVTVGSTHFDSLVSAVLSEETLRVLKKKGYNQLVVQAGDSKRDILDNSSSSQQWTLHSIMIDVWQYKTSIKDEIGQADLVISHAGSGTILEVLRTPKPLIAVSNPALLHDHQRELAAALESLGHLRTATTETLSTVIQDFDPGSIVPFPSMEPSRFRSILDEFAGF